MAWLRHEGSELGDVLSDDFWISPTDAREALDMVRRSAMAFNEDMKAGHAAGKVPPLEFVEWQKWLRQFDQYYRDRTDSFLGWRLLDSTGVLSEAEALATDLGAWRDRYEHYAGQRPATPPPVRTHAGPTLGPVSATRNVLATVGFIGTAVALWHLARR